VGKQNLDKKEVPLIALTGQSETGKTEFLRWVSNNYCTYRSGERTDSAIDSLNELNDSLPTDHIRLENILVLFASINQTSTYMKDEGSKKLQLEDNEQR
jgi:hypothetical protein